MLSTSNAISSLVLNSSPTLYLTTPSAPVIVPPGIPRAIAILLSTTSSVSCAAASFLPAVILAFSSSDSFS